MTVEEGLTRMTQGAMRKHGWTREKARTAALAWLRSEMEGEPLEGNAFWAEMILESWFARAEGRRKAPPKERVSRTVERAPCTPNPYISQLYEVLQQAETRFSPGQRARAAGDSGELAFVG